MDAIEFHTQSGVLVAHRSGTAPDLTVSLDFPSDPPTEAVDAAAVEANRDVSFFCNTVNSMKGSPCVTILMDSGGNGPCDVAFCRHNRGGR